MGELAVETTAIPGLLVVRLGLQPNDDGWFKEDWHRAKMTALGLPDFDPVQHNVTHVVARGITRGFLAEPWDRMVSVSQGRAMGAWVDLRAGAGFGRTFTCDLDPGTAVFVPRGVGNAHQVLADDTTFSYLLEHHWTPQARHRSASVDLFDPALGITWPIGREHAIVAHRDRLHPLLADAKPLLPRRTLVVGTETGLGRALVAAMPGAAGLATAALSPDAVSLVDLSAYDTIVSAHGDLASGLPGSSLGRDGWAAAAARAHRLTDIARRHHLRYVHVSSDCDFERAAPTHDEDDPLSLRERHGQALAAAELVAGSVPRHLIVRTGWVVGVGEGFVEDVVAAARRGERRDVIGDQYGRLTFADQLAAGITHLLDVSAPAGVYNISGDGRVASWADLARRVYELRGADPGLVREVGAAGAGAGGRGPGEASGAALVLSRVKATGFRPGDSWLLLGDRVSDAAPVLLTRPRRASGGVVGRSISGRLVAGAGDPAAAGEGAGGPGFGEAGLSVASPAGGQGPYRVLFVCTANICRSAYAAVVASYAGDDHAGIEGVLFGSAGTRALVGQSMDPPMAGLVGRRGDPSEHSARQLTRELMAEPDLVITMSANQRRYILDEWPDLGRKAFIIGQVAREMGRLPESVTIDTLADHLWRHRSSVSGDEVADPYMRGPAAAREAARVIDGHLAVIVGRLGELVARAGGGGVR